LKDGPCVAEQSDKAAALWRLPDCYARLISGASDDAERSRRLERAVTATGEALFLAAELKRAAAEAIAFPVYKGPGTREDVMAFINGGVLDWLNKKRPAIVAAEGAYVAVLQISPATPVHEAVAAAERVGTMWDHFVREFRSAPMPTEWKGTGVVPGTTDVTYEELRAEYAKTLAESSEPQRRRSRQFFTLCRDLGAKNSIADEHTRACEAALASTN
jgi:hypothetical protein